MWNNSSPNMPYAKSRLEKVVSEVTATPSTDKRQRRPNVRLEELGDQHGSSKMSPARVNLGTPVSLEENIHLSNDWPNYDLGSPSCPVAVAENDDSKVVYPDVLQASCNASGPLNFRRQKQKPLTRKKGRGRPPRVAQMCISKKKLTSVPQSSVISINAHHEPEIPCMQVEKSRYSGRRNIARSSVGFVPSACHEARGSLEARMKVGNLLQQSPSNNVAGNCSRPAQSLHGKTRQEVQESSRIQNFEAINGTDGNCLAQPNEPVRGPRGRLVIKRNVQFHGLQNMPAQQTRSGRFITETSNGHIAQLQAGVREWLLNLGLGKYIGLFEAHEVGPEVLPLLTFDDLREIGVFAVGSRRKMFSSIQQFGVGIGQMSVRCL